MRKWAFALWFALTGGLVWAGEQDAGAETLVHELLERGQFDRAIEQLQELMMERPQDARLHMLLGLAYRDGVYSRQADAASELARALELDPSLPLAHTLARLQVEMGEREEALRLLRERIRRFPSDSDALRALAELVQAEGRGQEAEALLRRALEVQPADAEAWLLLGRGCLRRGRRCRWSAA